MGWLIFCFLVVVALLGVLVSIGGAKFNAEEDKMYHDELLRQKSLENNK